MSWTSPILRCPCGYVGKPRLVEGASAHTWIALCRQCAALIKTIPRLGVPVRLEAEPEPVAGEAGSGARLYDKRDLPRAALQELARRKLKALGLDPDVPSTGKQRDG